MQLADTTEQSQSQRRMYDKMLEALQQTDLPPLRNSVDSSVQSNDLVVAAQTEVLDQLKARISELEHALARKDEDLRTASHSRAESQQQNRATLQQASLTKQQLEATIVTLKERYQAASVDLQQSSQKQAEIEGELRSRQQHWEQQQSLMTRDAECTVSKLKRAF